MLARWVPALILLAIYLSLIACQSMGSGTCNQPELTCPLGTQKECEMAAQRCECHCHSLDNSPFAPVDSGSNGRGNRGVETPTERESE